MDVQERMLDGLRRRAGRAGLLPRIDLRLAREESLGVEDLAGRVDLALAFAMVHELPDAGRFFQEVRRTLAPGGVLFLAEPTGHVSGAAFEATLAAAEQAGLHREPGPAVARNLTALLR